MTRSALGPHGKYLLV
jgi:T-complex protein 1 subunit theta